jgi:uncharacterized membrane protein YozB (DUF420 family)
VTIADLPSLNAALNGTAAVLLILGYRSIRRGRIARHRALMLTAFCTSVLFLISYLTYHTYMVYYAHVGLRRFPGEGPIRIVYLTILATHTVLAAAVPPLALITLWRALANRFDRHRAIARWTLPIWLYVSVTGVVVYFMLYQLY